MWGFASDAIAGSIGPRKMASELSQAGPDCSDDEVSSCTSREEGLECPICLESFNIVENVPYVLWCGHTLCKNCVMGLQWAVLKFPNLPVQLPLFISCPWCHLFSFRLVYKGSLKFPRTNFFLLGMVESMTSERGRSYSSVCGDHQPAWPSNRTLLTGSDDHSHRRVPQYMPPGHLQPDSSHEGVMANYSNAEWIYASLQKSLAFFVHLTAKFPLVLIFVIIVVYAIPASAVILALYILVTLLFALPSLLMFFFAYSGLVWLVREIMD